MRGEGVGEGAMHLMMQQLFTKAHTRFDMNDEPATNETDDARDPSRNADLLSL